MNHHIILASVAIILAGCTSTSHLKDSNGEGYKANGGSPVTTSDIFKNGVIRDSNNNKKVVSPVVTNSVTGGDAPQVDTSPVDTQTDKPIKEDTNKDKYDPFTGGLYGPYT